MSKTADFIEETKVSATKGESKEEKRARSNANLRKWQPGQSGNPSGRRKHDKAKQIAQEIFEQNEEAIYTAMGKSLLKGNAYTFKELAERAFGKLTEFKEVTHIHGELSDQDLDGQISRILQLVGTRDEIDALEPAGGKTAPNGKAKNHDLLPR